MARLSQQAVDNLFSLVLESLRIDDVLLNEHALHAVTDLGPPILDRLLQRAFHPDICPRYRVRLLQAVTVLCPGHEQCVDCYDIDRFLEDPSPRVRRAGRELHARIRAATPVMPPLSTMLASRTTRRDA